MPTNNVKRLAELSGYSESVVKRALGNYAGVRRQTKEHILALAEENGIRLSARRASVGVVMPSVPSFFWKRLADSIRSYAERRGLSVKFFFFSMIADESGALGCLEAALSSGISVLLTALPDTDAVRTYVKALADELTVILLDEDLAVENAFFVGEDSFAAGRRLAELCLENVELSDEVLI
jgi:DNA-binding LacI/PurR family transcriptional regulator